MIGPMPTGSIPGIEISAVIYEGLTVTVNGKTARLAVITDEGQVIATGADVAYEAFAVSINIYQNFLIGKGDLRVHSSPIELNKPLSQHIGAKVRA
jgi:hypothetical protein